MWHNLFVDQIPITEKIVRTVLVYALVAALIRATGKRGLSGLNTLDIVVMTLLANVVQNAVIGNDLSVTGAAIGAVTLVIVNAGLTRLAVVSPLCARIFDGTETRVIENGAVRESALRRLGLRRSSLDHAVRMQNGDDLSEVADGVLEPSGQLVLTLRKGDQGATRADVQRIEAQLARIEALIGRG